MDEELKKEIGRKIKMLREGLGYSQKEFAEMLNCVERTYGGYERGERTQPISLLKRIATIGSTDLDWFLEGNGNDKIKFPSQINPKDAKELAEISDMINQALTKFSKILNKNRS